MRYSLAGTVVKSCRNGINSCSSSNELGAQYVWPHQTTIKRKSHQTWKACACLQPFSWSCFTAKADAAEKTRFRMVSTAFTLIERQFGEEPWDIRNSGTLWKRCITVRPTVALYLDELLIQKCKFGSQFSRHWPQLGLPHLALWHHVGVTIGITLD